MPTQEKFKRQQYVVDKRLQFGMTLRLLSVPLGIAALYVLGVYVLPGDALESRTAAESRNILLLYFALGTAILAVVGLLLTHRVAGPAFAMQRRIQAFLQGERGVRVRLRKHDHLKGLAGAIRGLMDSIEQTEREQNAVLADLDRCLQEGDSAAARELITRLRPAPATEPEVAKEQV